MARATHLHVKTVRVRHTIGPSTATKTSMTVLCEERGQSIRVGDCFRCEKFGWLEVDSLSDRLVLRCSGGQAEQCPAETEASGDPLSKRLSETMTSKVYCVAPETPFEILAILFLEHEISAAPVVDAGGRAVGVVSKTDLVRALFGRERSDGAQWLIHDSDSAAERLLRLAAAGAIEEGTAESLMTPFPETISESASIGEAVRMMADNRRHHLVVISSAGVVVGILSALDIVHIIRTHMVGA